MLLHGVMEGTDEPVGHHDDGIARFMQTQIGFPGAGNAVRMHHDARFIALPFLHQ